MGTKYAFAVAGYESHQNFSAGLFAVIFSGGDFPLLTSLSTEHCPCWTHIMSCREGGGSGRTPHLWNAPLA